MKAYTDLEQSKILSKILPKESADMYWYLATKGDPKAMFNEEYSEYGYFEFPCWSLSALLNVLLCPSLHETFGGWRCDSYNKEGTSYILGKPSDNPVDTCVNMIIELNEKNLL